MSRPISYRNCLIGTLIILGGLISCHQDPAVPASLIPLTCQIELASFIDTITVTTYTYKYDSFGNQVASKGPGAERTYTFDADQYLTSQTVNGTAYTYTYTGTPKLISHIAGGDETYDYTYEGSVLKTFVVKKGSSTDTYEFTSGQLNKVTLGTGEAVVVNAQGKIAQKTTGSVITNYQYDGQGQTTQKEVINSAAGIRTVSQYTYDTKLFASNATLRARGFPVLPLDGQPGYDAIIGDPVLINNYQTITTVNYKKNSAGTYDMITSNTLTYRHQYNNMGFSLGYARSDGARAKFYYINCKTQ